VEAVKSGAIQAEVARQAYLFHQRLQSGEIPKVAVNCYLGDEGPGGETPRLEVYAFDPQVAAAQVAKLARVRRGRDPAAAEQTLARLWDEARGTANLMEPILEAVKAYATLGEIAGALRAVFGEHREAVAV